LQLGDEDDERGLETPPITLKYSTGAVEGFSGF
jgi:hypothetical protein